MKIGYGRVSSEDQSLEIQTQQLLAAGCEESHLEKQSGTSLNKRTELEKALSRLRKGDALVVYRVDRLSRSPRDTLNILHRIEAASASLIIIDQKIDTSTPEGKAWLMMLITFAGFETDLRKKRQAEGIANKLAKGSFHKKTRESVIDKMKPRAEELLLAGLNKLEIAKRLGLSERSIYRLLPKGTTRESLKVA
jgi:DNA invertase Pin-like site-specific DNA recombinase